MGSEPEAPNVVPVIGGARRYQISIRAWLLLLFLLVASVSKVGLSSLGIFVLKEPMRAPIVTLETVLVPTIETPTTRSVFCPLVPLAVV